MEEDKNKPVFPSTTFFENEGEIINFGGHLGITMRDYFAAKAMQGMLASGANWSNMYQCDNGKITGDVLSAYKIADAMLKARE